jgi:N-acyl-D-aspartate/D-glutamate deacylase
MSLASPGPVSRSSPRRDATRLALLLVTLLGACSRPYDVIIENGRVVDGTGNPWMYGDVGIKGDRIAIVAPRGALHGESARLKIDAHGHVVAPGFIDIQNHSWDNVLWKDGRVPSMVTQGVTSVILGESTTPGPSNEKLEELEEVAKIDSARAAGLDVGATMYPYPYSGNNLGACIPDWASENGKLFDNLRDSTTRARIVREMSDPTGAPFCQIEGPDNYVVADLRKPENARYEGKKLSEVAAGMHLPWPDAVVALMLSEGRDPSKINFSMSEDNVRMQIVKPWVVIGTDAGGYDPDSTKRMVHPRAYGTYPRILGRYVREEKLLTLEDAVRRMTGGVAARLGLRDRGLLREGMYADAVVFDDATIIDLSTPAKPHVLSRGVEQVFVNGVQVVRDGRHTGATPGRVLRRR